MGVEQPDILRLSFVSKYLYNRVIQNCERIEYQCIFRLFMLKCEFSARFLHTSVKCYFIG